MISVNTKESRPGVEMMQGVVRSGIIIIMMKSERSGDGVELD